MGACRSYEKKPCKLMSKRIHKKNSNNSDNENNNNNNNNNCNNGNNEDYIGDLDEEKNGEKISGYYDESLKEFPDFPVWGNNKLCGLGIREMPAYKCDLKVNELNKKIAEFWKSKKNKGEKWRYIHQACLLDNVKAEEYLFANGLRTLEGCINMLIDDKGNIYRIPNYCINEPYFEKEILPIEENRNQIIHIVLFDITNQKHLKLDVNENITGKEIIEKYANKFNIDLSSNKIRLLFGGTIIKENEHLYQHKIKNKYSIQICVSKIL